MTNSRTFKLKPSKPYSPSWTKSNLKESKQKIKDDTDDKLMQFRKSIAIFDSMMTKPEPQQSESRRRKMSRLSLPPEEEKMTIEEDSEGEQENDKTNSNNNASKSDD